jgi:hypothetical protein
MLPPRAGILGPGGCGTVVERLDAAMGDGMLAGIDGGPGTGVAAAGVEPVIGRLAGSEGGTVSRPLGGPGARGPP